MQTVTITLTLPDGIAEEAIRNAIRGGFERLKALTRTSILEAAETEAEVQVTQVHAALDAAVDDAQLVFGAA